MPCKVQPSLQPSPSRLPPKPTTTKQIQNRKSKIQDPMSLYYPVPQPTIADNILVRRERRLPVPGEVLVKAGIRVEPADIIAQSVITSDPVQVNVAADI